MSPDPQKYRSAGIPAESALEPGEDITPEHLPDETTSGDPQDDQPSTGPRPEVPTDDMPPEDPSAEPPG